MARARRNIPSRAGHTNRSLLLRKEARWSSGSSLWHARNLKGGGPGLGEGEGTSRDVRQRPEGGREVREARLGRVSSEFRLRRSFMKYPIYPEGRVKFLTDEGLPGDPPLRLSTRLKYIRHERGCNTRHFTRRSRLKYKHIANEFASQSIPYICI